MLLPAAAGLRAAATNKPALPSALPPPKRPTGNRRAANATALQSGVAP